MRFNKLAGLIAVGSAVALFGSVVVADPPETPVATDDASFYGTVENECSLNAAVAEFDASGVEYTITSTPAGGTNADISDSTSSLEERAIKLEAFDTASFDCNTNTVAISVEMTADPTYPSDAPANLVLDGTQVSHDVIVDAFEVGTATLLDNVGSSQMLIAATISKDPVPTDGNGDLDVTVTSTFEALAAEELPAGGYGADFTVTVTAN